MLSKARPIVQQAAARLPVFRRSRVDPAYLTLEKVVARHRGQISEGTLRNWRTDPLNPCRGRNALRHVEPHHCDWLFKSYAIRHDEIHDTESVIGRDRRVSWKFLWDR
jgi:hypothetical protein